MALESTVNGAAPQRPGGGVLARLRQGVALLAESGCAMVGLGIIVFWCLVAIFAPLLTSYSPTAIDPAALGKPWPSAAHWLGTDHLGRDIWARLAYGARTVLTVAPIAVAGAVFGGILLGMAAGYFRGWIDVVITRLCDIVLSFPVLMLYMIILATLGSSAFNIIMVVTIVKAPYIARIVRGSALEIREREYIAAARMRGEHPLYVMLVEMLPNARGPLIVETCLRLGYTIITIGALGFLGIGLPPPTPDWGGMVKDTYGMMVVWPHMSLIPCAAVSSLVIGFNLLAVGLREIGLRD
ncbi:MAG: ABC transporter permease [Alphaproteobacteria bacterium]|nr:ABC transporter permease [Alphaproteobacteria bacterium]